MSKLSVLIPSRNEPYLYPTIRDCFAKAAGEIEVVVHLDGYWPSDWKTMTDAYPNLHTVHSGESVGMRPGINKAAGSAISRGAKYLFKLDAHCLLDEGFDEKLLEQIEPNWIVVPRRKRLDPDAWAITETHKPDIDYHYLSFPDDPNDWGGKGLNGKVWEQRARERRDNPEYDLDDEMSSQGSAWLMAASYFQELELMDAESYGPFWNEAQELFLKCWLSGGRGVINKKTFYAHLHKGTKHGRGYRLPESWLQQGATFTKRWMYNEAWPKQTLPFKWLIEHFWPVPTWPDNWEEVLYATRRPRDVGNPVRVTVADSGVDGGVADTASYPAVTTVSQLEILEAHYGIGGSDVINVKDELRRHIRNDSLDIVVNNSTLTPGQNPFRGKKKKLWVTYCWNSHGEGISVEREEKDWLIIGPVGDDSKRQFQEAVTAEADIDSKVEAGRNMVRVAVGAYLDSLESDYKAAPVAMTDPPRTAAALNDYLIRRFSISPQRLRGPMPIELRDFHRNDLAQLFAELGFKRGAEIGVAEGNYSEVLLKANPECELLLVDPWHAYSENPQNKSKEKHTYAFNEMMRKTDGYEGRRVQMMSSMKAVGNVEESSLDFCYIDGNHLFDYVMQDLIEWSKRVRSGGIISGDDYYALDQKRWIGGGVVEAVQAYVNAHRIPVWWLFEGHKSVDFMWVKP